MNFKRKLRKKYSFVMPSLPDERDRIYVAGSTTPIVESSLREYRGGILNQGSWGSCTGHGTAGMLHSTYKRITGINIDFNPFWIWYWARRSNGWEKNNTGAYPRDVFKNLISRGVCENPTWSPTNYSEAPPKLPDSDLIKFKSYHRIHIDKDNFDNTKNDFAYCIAVEQLPIGITMAVHASFETYTSETGSLLTPNINDPIVGYHWVYVDGVDEEGITVVNSWGENWGDSGTFQMPWDYVRKYVVEAWSLDPSLP